MRSVSPGPLRAALAQVRTRTALPSVNGAAPDLPRTVPDLLVVRNSAASRPAALTVRSVVLPLRFLDDGPLLPWLGPALRGVTAREFRARACVQPATLQKTQWKYCLGCPYAAHCTYGQVFEPQVLGRDAQTPLAAPRSIVIGSEAPLPPTARRGFTWALRLVAVGHAAERLPTVVDAALCALATQGLGPRHVRSEPDGPPTTESHSLAREELSDHAFANATRPVQIRLLSPLVLRGSGPRDARRRLERPTLSDLFRAAARTVRQAFAGVGLPEPEHESLLPGVAAARPLAERWQTFQQRKWSNRQQSGFDVHGVLGEAVFGDVPLAAIPWLIWGGRLHVGEHRVAGAGRWEAR